MQHLYDVPKRREAETLRRMLTPRGPSGALADVLGFGQLGWMGLGLPTSRLYPDATPNAPGDIDIVGGPLSALDTPTWEAALAAAKGHPYLASLHLLVHGGIAWPPVLSRVGAVDAKVARCELSGHTRRRSLGPQTQEDARAQARGLCELGFDRVALARIVVSHPVHANVGSSWMAAGAIAGDAADRYADSVIAPPDDPFETLVLSLGAVAHKTEDLAGAEGLHLRENAGPNPLRQTATALVARASFEGRLREVFSARPRPIGTPVFVLACAKTKRCGELYTTCDSKAPCPRCSGPSTVMAG